MTDRDPSRHPADGERVFNEQVIRANSLGSALVAFVTPLFCFMVGLFVLWLLGGLLPLWLAGLAGLASSLALLLWVQDHLAVMFANRRLARALAEKLRRLGVLNVNTADPSTYFVGLAHPSRTSWWRLETDDDIGYLQLTDDGLEYHGDSLLWRADYADIEAVELVPIGYGLPSSVKRIRLRFADGEPYDELLLTSREGDRLKATTEVTLTLHEALVHRCQPSERLREAALEVEQSLADDLGG